MNEFMYLRSFVPSNEGTKVHDNVTRVIFTILRK